MLGLARPVGNASDPLSTELVPEKRALGMGLIRSQEVITVRYN